MHVFQDKDGKYFVLLSDVWDHIVKGHPEMERYFNEIGSVLYRPTIIRQSKKFGHCVLYYRRIKSSLHCVVVVDILKGIIKTSYITDRIKEGEIIWQEKK